MLILLGIWIIQEYNKYIVQIFSSEFDLIPKKTPQYSHIYIQVHTRQQCTDNHDVWTKSHTSEFLTINCLPLRIMSCAINGGFCEQKDPYLKVLCEKRIQLANQEGIHIRQDQRPHYDRIILWVGLGGLLVIYVILPTLCAFFVLLAFCWKNITSKKDQDKQVYQIMSLLKYCALIATVQCS